MKYYIPTSSLNLDNILQAECISPLSFYAHRKTGYKLVELINEVRQYNHIVLFDYPVSFSIEDSGRYNYPLLIEIEDDLQLQDINNIKNTGMYLCGHTIYLTPKNCIFYFFSENAYKLTTINTKGNKSIKYYEQYRIYSSASQLKLKALKIVDITDTIDVCDNNEPTIDKQKGVLYAFLLGQLMSITPSLSHQLMLSQELYNILTGIISTPQMKDKFLNNLKYLLEEYKSVDPIELKNKNLFEDKFNADLGRFKFLKSGLIDMLSKWGVWDYVFQRLSSKWGCQLLPNVTTLYTGYDFSLLRDEIECRTNNALKEYQNKQPPPSIDYISIRGDMIYIEGMPIINRAIKYIIKSKLTAERLSAVRLNVYKELIGEVVDEIKKTKGEEYWANSLERDYVNNLYNHILDIGMPFNLKMVNNPELVAVAAFLLRGQSIGDFTLYLKQNEVHDYRYGLALWGALCGYMEMNKEFLLKVLTMSNYINVYERLFDRTMGELKQVHPETILIDDTDKQDFLAILREFRVSEKIFNALKISLDACCSSDIKKCINDTLASNDCKKSRKQCVLARSAYQLVLVRNDEEIFRSVLKDIDTTDKIRKAVASYFGISFSLSKQKKSKEKSGEITNKAIKKVNMSKSSKEYTIPNLFDASGENRQDPDLTLGKTFAERDKSNVSSTAILNNTFWINGCLSLIKDTQAQRQFKEDVEWFVSNHEEFYYDRKKNIFQKGIYFGHDRTSLRVIDRLRVYMENKLHPKNHKMQWLAHIYTNIPIDLIVKHLQSIYAPR